MRLFSIKVDRDELNTVAINMFLTQFRLKQVYDRFLNESK